MVATVISKPLSVKLGTVLIAALAASTIDAPPAVAGSRAARPCSGLRGHGAASRMGRVLCAATGLVCQHREGTARPCSFIAR